MVYLIHFDRPLKHAQHYIGYTTDLDKRFHAHSCTGDGAKLLHAVRDAGIGFKVVNTWKDGDRSFERELKNKKNAKWFCPICNPNLNCYTAPEGLVYAPDQNMEVHHE